MGSGKEDLGQTTALKSSTPLHPSVGRGRRILKREALCRQLLARFWRLEAAGVGSRGFVGGLEWGLGGGLGGGLDPTLIQGQDQDQGQGRSALPPFLVLARTLTLVLVLTLDQGQVQTPPERL